MPDHSIDRRSFLSASVASIAGAYFSSSSQTLAVEPALRETEGAKMRALDIWNEVKTVLAEHRKETTPTATPENPLSFLLGQHDTDITSIEGSEGTLHYKQATIDDRWPAVLTQEFSKLQLKKGDLVAVGTTGSMPATTLSVLTALKALEVRPVVIASVASSSYGANNPDFTILHMLEACAEKGTLPYFPVAASPGGTHDRAANKDIDDELVKEIISKFETTLLWPRDTLDSTNKRLEIFEQEAGGDLGHYKFVINIGGGGAMCGGGYGFYAVPSGIHKSLEWDPQVKPYCVLTYLAHKYNCPFANLRDITKIGRPEELQDLKEIIGPQMEAKKVRASKKSSYAPMWYQVPREALYGHAA